MDELPDEQCSRLVSGASEGRARRARIKATDASMNEETGPPATLCRQRRSGFSEASCVVFIYFFWWVCAWTSGDGAAGVMLRS